MSDIGLFFGSSTGNTAGAADQIVDAFAVYGISVEVYGISRSSLSKITEYDKLIFGCPTWNIGELQDDWALVIEDFSKLDLTGNQVAIFGYGDQYAYPDSYQDALGIIALACVDIDADVVGFWPADGYEYEQSQAVFEDMFCGLALDDSEMDQAEEIVRRWVNQLIIEYQLREPVA